MDDPLKETYGQVSAMRGRIKKLKGLGGEVGYCSK